MSTSRMLDVVVVSDFAHVEGGNSAVALSSAIGLTEAGHRVTLLSAVPPIDPAVERTLFRVVCTGQQSIADDPQRMRALIQGLWNRTAGQTIEQILSTLDRHRTVVHVHGWTKALSSSVIRAALLQKFKVVCTLHDYFSACPNGSFFNYPSNTVCELQPLSYACITSQCDRRQYAHKLWRVARQVVQMHFGGMPDKIRHFIIVSEFSGRLLAPFIPLGSHIYHVQNPVLASYEDPVDARSNSAYVMIGRIDQEKGPETFAAAAEIAGCQAVFVGNGEMRENIARLLPSARFTGWLPREGVQAELCKARALVFPSLWYETDGLTAVEAAARGIPVIVSDTSAARESVIDGVTGLWFRAGDARDLAEKIAALQDDDCVQRIGHAAYQNYWKNPRTLDRHITELEQTYEKVLAC